jgi:carbonic anhydrase
MHMPDFKDLFDNNRAWAKKRLQEDPQFFEKLANLQAPEFMWIGCSDSRVPANQIMGLAPGEVFVHRNVANLAVSTDMNYLSVLQFAVEVLKVKHVIVCGHYGCGGVRAACDNVQLGLIDNWLRNIKDTYTRHRKELERITDAPKRSDRLCELNVLTQVHNVCHTTIVQNAWSAGRELSVHGLIYSLKDGLLHDLALQVSRQDQLADIYKMDMQNAAGG